MKLCLLTYKQHSSDDKIDFCGFLCIYGALQKGASVTFIILSLSLWKTPPPITTEELMKQLTKVDDVATQKIVAEIPHTLLDNPKIIKALQILLQKAKDTGNFEKQE